MPVLSYEVGAAFILEDRVTGPLAEIGRAFEALGEVVAGLQERLATVGEGAFTGFLAGIDRAETALTRMMDQTNAVAGSWDRAAAAAERYAAAAGTGGGTGGGLGGGGGGGRGRGGGLTDDERTEREAARQLAEDRRNADAINRNENQIYSRQEAAARRDNTSLDDRLRRNQRERDSGGIYGPTDEGGYGGYDEAGRLNDRFDTNQRMNAEAENSNRDLVARRQEQEAARERKARADAAGTGFVSGHAGGVMKGMAPLVAGVAGYEAEKSAMQEQIAIKQALMGINITEDMPNYEASYERLHNLAYTSTKGTKFSNVEAAKTLREALPVLAMEGEEALNTADKTFPIALRLGELSSHRGKGTIGSEAVAAEEFAHLEQNYDPEHMVKSLDQINAIAMKNDTSVRAQLGIMKYGLPTAMLAGIDPEKAAGEIGAAELRMGATSTAGTGYSRWLLGGMVLRGKVGAGQSREHAQKARAAEHEFEHALKLDGGLDAVRAHVTSVSSDAHDAAVRRLGIYDKDDHLLARTPSGAYDEDKVKELMAKYAATHDREDTLRTMEKAFQVQGSRFGEAYLNPDMIARERAQMQTFKNAPPVAKELEGLAGTAMQQFEQMLANISNTGNILANETLPGLTKAFTVLNTGLLGLNDWLTEHKTAAAVGGWGAVTAAGATGLGLLGAGASMMWKWSGARALTRGVGGLLGMGSGDAAATGVGVGETALGGSGLFGPMGLLAGGMLAAGGVAGHMQVPMVDDQGRVIGSWGDKDESHNPAAAPGFRASTGLAGPRAAGTPATPPPAAAPGPISINVGPVTMSGVADAATFQGLLDKLTSAIKSALTHSAEGAYGPGMSPYTVPGAF